MYLLRDPDDPRRRLLVKLLAAGSLASLPIHRVLADVLGEKPEKLPPDRSIYRLSGTVSVNGSPANLKTRIGGNDTIETGRNSEVVFVSGSNAFILRESSRMSLSQQASSSSAVASALRLLTGKILAVFGPGVPQRISTATATIGIRGTGVYAETDPEQTYFCTCYGVTDINANSDPNSRKTVTSKHHDEPVYILAKPKDGKAIRKAPFINHTDQELMLIETLVGRSPPFVFPSEDYGGPRKDY
ncbi:MAG TPA: FecR domain-containing protein [Burkholderiales bacterium]|nr:FecR domain-containing protein [Burkholderiales bacterium]